MRRRLLICLTILYCCMIQVQAQVCNPVTCNYSIQESRCVATGAVTIQANGGSGNYQYKVSGPVNTPFSAAATITGLPPGTYLVSVQDMVTNCIYTPDNIIIPGTYQTPVFTLGSTPASCANTFDGSIFLITQTGGRQPLNYQIVAPSPMAIGTINTTGNFNNLIAGTYTVRLTDSCGAIQTKNIIVETKGWKIDVFSYTKSCDTLHITLLLKDDAGNTTPSAAFDNFQYGVVRSPGDTMWVASNSFSFTLQHRRSLTIVVKDPCGRVRTVSWTETAIPALDPQAITYNLVCTGFTAAVTGALHLQNAQYCLYNQSNAVVACNTTGTFTNIPYGSYCIKAIDLCYDTIITRCFAVAKLIPAVTQPLLITADCASASVSVTGGINFSNPDYCLYTAANTLVSCNTSGVFTGIPFGSYCIRITNNPLCYDTIITRCFTVAKPLPAAAVAITNQTCASFTAQVQNAANLSQPQFCLYNGSGVQISCNTTGIFNNLPFGTYCMQLVNNSACYDTTMNFCFTVVRPLPAVGNTVNLSATDCPPYTASLNGLTGLSNPQFCLYNSNNQLIECNTTGSFTVNSFGSFCIRMQNDPACYDTVITRCFTRLPTPVDFTAVASPSCALIGGTDIFVDISSGIRNYNLSVYTPGGVLVASGVTIGSNRDYLFSGLPVLPGNLPYKIVVTDLCGTSDSLSVTPQPSRLNRKLTTTSKCPSGSLTTGSGDVSIDIADNNIGGNIKSKIIRRNGIVVSINGNAGGGNSTITVFANLSPGTYVIATNIANCDTDVFDTVTIAAYSNPSLQKSAAYTCNNNSISIGAGVTGGVSPFNYEIISSTPSLPSIITAPQSNPVFNINNGTAYTLIRLRVIDACGNAGLNDVGIQPLGAMTIHPAGYDCFYSKITLREDSLANATYKWYKKTSATDSVLVGTSSVFTIPYMMPSDTGWYSCVTVINAGCLNRYATYHVAAQCTGLLNPVVSITGSMNSSGLVTLHTQLPATVLSSAVQVQSSASPQGPFTTAQATYNQKGSACSFFVTTPVTSRQYFRLKVTTDKNEIEYSNLLSFEAKQFELLRVYPNPVHDRFSITLPSKVDTYILQLMDNTGKVVLQQQFTAGTVYEVNSLNQLGLHKGVYILRLRSSREQQMIVQQKLMVY